MEAQPIPAAMRELPQWGTWFFDAQQNKVPRLKSNDPATWTHFDNVERSPRKAFVFSAGDGLCGIDLDDCLDEGEFSAQAEEILERFRPYAYGEFSPSNRGVKLTFRGVKPAGSISVRAATPASPQRVECYDKLRFWTVTGEVLPGFEDIRGDAQPALDWLVEKYLTPDNPTAAAAPPQRPAGQVVTASELQLEQRGLAYIDTCEPASEGSRNAQAFRVAGHLHALADDYDGRMAPDRVLAILSIWNTRNSPPLPAEELAKVCEKASRCGTPRAPKPPEATALEPLPAPPVPLSRGKGQGVSWDGPTQDIPATIAKALDQVHQSKGVGPSASSAASPLPACVMFPPGLLAEIADYTLGRSLYRQPELALAGALALLSCITGRKVKGEWRTRTNLYILGLAPSGAGKDFARDANKELLQAAGGERLLGPERIGSSAGLTKFTEDRLAPLFQLDEIGRLLKTMRGSESKSPHLYNIGTVLMQLYSSSGSIWQGDAYADMKNTPRINQPHAVVYGTAVPQGFWEGLTAESMSDGLLGRFLVFEARGYADLADPNDDPPPGDLVAAIRRWLEFAPGGDCAHENPRPVVLPYTDEARLRMRSHINAINERRKSEGPDAAAIWSRSAEKAAKLAMLFAISRNIDPPGGAIELQDIDRGIALANHLTRRMLTQAGEYLSSNETESEKKRLMRIIGEGRLTMNQLTRRTQWLDARKRTSYLTDLEAAGMLRMVREDKPSGRPAIYIERATDLEAELCNA